MWGRVDFFYQSLESNFSLIINSLSRLAYIVLIFTAILLLDPADDSPSVSRTGKKLLSVGAIVGLASSILLFLDIVCVTKGSNVNGKMRWACRVSMFSSILVYAAFVYHIMIKNFESRYTYLVPLIDSGIGIICLFGQ